MTIPLIDAKLFFIWYFGGPKARDFSIKFCKKAKMMPLNSSIQTLVSLLHPESVIKEKNACWRRNLDWCDYVCLFGLNQGWSFMKWIGGAQLIEQWI